jgi:hypothetical protein
MEHRSICLALEEPSGVRHSDRHLFEVRFPLHFRARTGSGKLGTGGKDVPQGLKRVCENSRSKHQGGEIRERAREAGAKARNILNRLRPD